ncbi:glycosyltransferase, partial [bacterium]|nr:glycosyltransferase [bacterium]
MESFIAFLFWLSFGILLYIYVGYILLLKILTFFYRQSHDIDSAYTPTITLLFSAHNEREALPQKVESLKKIQYPRDKLQIIAISDGSTDGTAEFLQTQEGIQTQVLQENVGKNAALNLALPNAKGEILFFTDANTVLHPHCFRAIARNYA